MNPYGISRPAPAATTRRPADRPERVPETYLTVTAIAAELNVSKMTVYRLIERRELIPIRVGRSYRVAETEFARYLAVDHGTPVVRRMGAAVAQHTHRVMHGEDS